MVFVIYPNIVLLDLAGPLQVFAGARHPSTNALAYSTAITSLDGGKVLTDTLVSIDTVAMDNWANRKIHTLVVVGGNGANDVMHNDAFLRQVSTLAEQATRVCSVCSGALILAAIGILDGRRATTHWEDCAHLTQDFPNVTVEPDPIYIKDGNVWTSAGITAGLDMTLAMVAEDCGKPAALELAQSLVTYMVRPGGQSQFSPALDRQNRDRPNRFERLYEWISKNIQSNLNVDRLAEFENMSVRSFQRVFSATMGTTPAKAVECLRIEAARELLETTDIRIKSIAHRCGFQNEERMRRSFIRSTGTSPSEYRRRFQL
ncbi:MAG: helix-turn-helix domain-containing protein [Pseudomonadota bacterium]